MNKKALIAALIIIAIAIAAWMMMSPTEPEPVTDTAVTDAPIPEVVVTPPAPAEQNQSATGGEGETRAAQDPIVAPPAGLAESGDEAQAAATELSPEGSRWLAAQEPVRKAVLLVDLAASGRVPVKNRPIEYPTESFAVERRDGELYLDDANYERADRLVAAITAISPEQFARYYRSWRPLLEQAHDELGRQDTFDQRLQAAVQQVLDTEPLEGEVRLQQPNVFYTYADPKLEAASDVSKLMWRIGPDNTRKLQNWLREVEPLL